LNNAKTVGKAAKPVAGIPARSRQAIIDLVDLSDYYTTSLDDEWAGKKGLTFSAFPKGIHAYRRGAFDIRGLIQLSGKNTLEKTGYDYPAAVKNIPVDFFGEKIDFLQGALGVVPENTKIGEYVLHYADGRFAIIPIIYNQNVVDCTGIQQGFQPMGAEVIEAGPAMGIYKYTVNNPFKDEKIQKIDFISEVTDCAPFLLAITLENFKTCMEHEWFDSIRVYNEIIPRGTATPANLIDLSAYFTASPDDDWFNHAGHDLHDLPKGLQEFGGVKFDVRGLLVLGGCKTSLKITGLALPEELLGIKIRQRGQKVHFLHACAFDSPRGTKIADYVVHYADNTTQTIPVVYGVNVMDWWERVEEGTVTEAEAVWYGSNAASRRFGLRTRVIKYAWDNPCPELEIVKIDFISALANSAPMLFAITVM